jgi:hypothetical protein
MVDGRRLTPFIFHIEQKRWNGAGFAILQASYEFFWWRYFLQICGGERSGFLFAVLENQKSWPKNHDWRKAECLIKRFNLDQALFAN